jgi:hypothetical protein
MRLKILLTSLLKNSNLIDICYNNIHIHQKPLEQDSLCAESNEELMPAD